LELVAYFLSPKNAVSEHHLHHAIHHNFTTKTPRSAPRISQKTPYKTPIHHDGKNTRPQTDFPIDAKQQRAGIAPGSLVYKIS
jgi:hypothetical protein